MLSDMAEASADYTDRYGEDDYAEADDDDMSGDASGDDSRKSNFKHSLCASKSRELLQGSVLILANAELH